MSNCILRQAGDTVKPAMHQGEINGVRVNASRYAALYT